VEPKERVLRLAFASQPVFRAKHAAALVYKGRVLATGVNKEKTHPLAGRFCKHPEAVWLHAELDCIVKVIHRHGAAVLSDCELYVARVLKDGSLAASCPCTGCQRAIEAFGIRKVSYTTKDGWND
jgi:deoxycytidylate deaminase